MASPWRLIPYQLASGSTQMVIDRALLDRHAPGSTSILRFYGWSPAALSLGFHQKVVPAHWHELAQQFGLDMVRRPTGGRAVLHQGDLCYAIITTTPFASRAQSYQYLCQFLIQGCGLLGLNLEFGGRGQPYLQNPNCFAIATTADLVTQNGQKLIGSAQVYRQGSVLQHGSILIQPDRALWQAFFGNNFMNDGAIASLAELLPANSPCASQHQLIANLTQAAASHFQAEFTEMPLTAAERAEIGV